MAVEMWRWEFAGIPSMSITTITEGATVCVTLHPDCAGDRPHLPVEDGMRGQVTGQRNGDHPYFVLFQGRARESRLSGNPFAMLPLGRWYAVDELEEIGY